MFENLPDTGVDALDWGPERYIPYFEALIDRDIDADNVNAWMADWSALACLVDEVSSRVEIATAQNTADSKAEAAYEAFMDHINPMWLSYSDRLNAKLLASGLTPEGMAVPLQHMRIEAELFRESNLDLIAEENKVGLGYDKILGAQTIDWQGEETTFKRLGVEFENPDRAVRAAAWRAMSARQLEDRDALNAIWTQQVGIRRQIARNADMPDYRAYMWQHYKRVDYTPEDIETFHRAIETEVVPAARRVLERRRDQLGVERLRPWDVGGGLEYGNPHVDPLGRAALRPYDTSDEFEERLQTIFTAIDPTLGEYFATMRAEDLLDIDNRKHKGGGGFQADLFVIKRPFIFANSVGNDDDVYTMLHECGHAFHKFETAKLPYYHQELIGSEIAEVASFTMEFMGMPYLTRDAGGFYSDADAAQSQLKQLERTLLAWPYMAVVDAFQSWAYTHPDGDNPEACDAQWAALWERFIPAIDYEGFEAIRDTGWHRKLHIFRAPLYYIEYALARLGAAQIWARSQTDQAGALRDYLHMMSLGATAPLPDLFAAAGARFAFDAATVRDVVQHIEGAIDALEARQTLS